MLACRELSIIAERLAEIFNNKIDPFGGVNMVFAGDFAQLPPAIGDDRESLYTRKLPPVAASVPDQRKIAGKALWHQVTTAVILRQNMRQTTQSPDDAKLRTALMNMRYGACTPDDIVFLESRKHSASDPKRPNLTDQRFRNVAIITSYNATKDAINRLGSKRFAMETNQELVKFYSDDVSSFKDGEKSKKPKRKGKKSLNNISPHVQRWLWNQPTSSSDKHIPGCLEVCVGLPVMIRTNLATELCITKGQEGLVHSWISGTGSKGQNILQVLFVRLVDPPQNVQFDGLPENVVPVYKTVTSTLIHLPRGPAIRVSRTQVEVLPNFAMTDYASQGKTRPNNPVDLNSSRTHLHIYTALSRSTSAEGTLILDKIPKEKITGGLTGALRQ
ncbi:hypothetical protein BDN72DRAFT_781140, partial [Pluteus cervinus]